MAHILKDINLKKGFPQAILFFWQLSIDYLHAINTRLTGERERERDIKIKIKQLGTHRTCSDEILVNEKGMGPDKLLLLSRLSLHGIRRGC